MRRSFEVLDRANPLMAAALAAMLHAMIYVAANRFPIQPSRTLPLSTLDQLIPLIPWTIWLYVSSHFLVFTAFVSCRAPGARGRFCAAFFLVVIGSALAHWLFPVAFPRELFPVPPSSVWGGAWLIERLRMVDTPSSCVPSLHVAAAVVSTLAATRELRKRAIVLWIWVGAVAVSTLTTKQHYVVDVLAGGLFAAVAYVVVYHWPLRARPTSARSSDGVRPRIARAA